MGAGDVVAGVIVSFLGLAGLADIYGESVLPFHPSSIGILLSPFGALVVFAAMAAIGVALIIGGALDNRPEVIVRESKTPVAVARSGTSGSHSALPDLDLAILRYVSQRKSEKEISDLIGVDNRIVSEKITKLRAEGYLTDKNELTEKGFGTMSQIETVIVRP